MVTELDGVDPDEVDLAPELRSNGTDGVEVLAELLVGGVDEEVRKRLAAGGVGLVVLRTDLVDDGDGELLDPLLNLLRGGRGDGVGELGLGLIEVTEDDDCRGSNASGLRDGLVGRETEQVVVTVLVRGRAEFRSRDDRC